MRYLVFFILFCQFTHILSRPGRLAKLSDENRDANVNEYEEDESSDDAPDDYALPADTNARANAHAANAKPDQNALVPNKAALQQKTMDSRFARADVKDEDGTDLNQANEDSVAPNDSSEMGYQELKNYNKYVGRNDVNDQSDSIQRVTNRDVSKLDNMRSDQNRKQSLTEIEESDLIFEKPNKNRYAAVDDTEQPQNADRIRNDGQQRYYRNRQRLMRFPNRNFKSDDSDRAYRDRREAKELATTEKTYTKVFTNEDEEAVIKNHIKRLSNDELQELLDSLSEDKKALLKKIIDTDLTNDNTINKREITKKAGAINENSLVDSENTKGQSGNEAIGNDASDSTISTTDKDSGNKQTDTLSDSNVNTAKSSDMKDDNLSDAKDNNLNLISFSVDTKAVTSKINSKRETSNEEAKESQDLDDSAHLDTDTNFNDWENEQDFYCSADDENSHDVNTADANVYKRDLLAQRDDELSNSLKSLEESFPNSNVYGNGDFNSDMAPLIRVKRKNTEALSKKHSISDLLGEPMSCASFKADNNDDSVEKSEFDENQFYGVSDLEDSDQKTVDDKLSETISDDQPSLGSDSDTVVTDVEEVNDNLMFKSETKN